MMLAVTDSAAAHLAELLSSADVPEEAVLRMRLRPDGRISLGVGTAEPDDYGFRHEGSLILVLDQETADGLQGKLLDVDENEDGSRELGLFERLED